MSICIKCKNAAVYNKVIVQKKLILIELTNQKSVKSVIATISVMVLNLIKVCNDCNIGRTVFELKNFAIVNVRGVGY